MEEELLPFRGDERCVVCCSHDRAGLWAELQSAVVAAVSPLRHVPLNTRFGTVSMYGIWMGPLLAVVWMGAVICMELSSDFDALGLQAMCPPGSHAGASRMGMKWLRRSCCSS